MKLRAATVLVVGMLAALACDEPARVVDPGGDPAMVDATPIVVDPDRCVLFDLVSAPATIEHLGLSGDLLTFSVQYSGGCANHSFTLHTGVCFLESWPPQSDIFLVHEDPGDPCDSVVTEAQVFDLAPLKVAYLDGNGGRSRTLVLNIHEPGKQGHYEPEPLYELEPR